MLRPYAFAAVLAIASPLAAVAVPGPVGPQTQHAVECVAALDTETQALAARVKAGSADLRPVLLRRLQAGVALIGERYLHDDAHDEDEAKALAAQARERQKSLTPAQLASRQSACADEGSRLLSSANPLQRAVVRRLAQKRMERLLRH